MSKEKEFIRVCPRCGSNNIAGAGRALTEVGYSCCKSCGYEGIFPEIEKDKVEKFKKMLRRKK